MCTALRSTAHKKAAGIPAAGLAFGAVPGVSGLAFFDWGCLAEDGVAGDAAGLLAPG